MPRTTVLLAFYNTQPDTLFYTRRVRSTLPSPCTLEKVQCFYCVKRFRRRFVTSAATRVMLLFSRCTNGCEIFFNAGRRFYDLSRFWPVQATVACVGRPLVSNKVCLRKFSLRSSNIFYRFRLFVPFAAPPASFVRQNQVTAFPAPPPPTPLLHLLRSKCFAYQRFLSLLDHVTATHNLRCCAHSVPCVCAVIT